MQQKINWVANLRGLACLMVIVIHTTSWSINHVDRVSMMSWNIANVLNSASRVCVPLFFMISGFLFFGERKAQRRHLVRITLCLGFYSLVSLIYIALTTHINVVQSLMHLFEKPVFFHLWFFFAIFVIYLLSPLIQVRQTDGVTVLALIAIVGVIANPNTVPQFSHHFQWLPVNLYINGDTFYYVVYGLLGRAIGNLNTERRGVTFAASALFVACVISISLGTHRELQIRGNFASTFYLYAGPQVFMASAALLVIFKNCANHRPLPLLAKVSGYSLPIYGFHALIIHFLRNRHFDCPHWPLFDLVWVFSATLAGSLLLAIGLQRLDSRRLVS